jgi:hypothetical protein
MFLSYAAAYRGVYFNGTEPFVCVANPASQKPDRYLSRLSLDRRAILRPPSSRRAISRGGWPPRSIGRLGRKRLAKRRKFKKPNCSGPKKRVSAGTLLGSVAAAL